MANILQTTEGIILRVVPFKDHDQILSLFSLQGGLLKVFYKGSLKKKGGWSPLTKVEITYSERQGELFSCHQITHLDSFPLLRKNLGVLDAACDLLRVILSSQLVGKAAPTIYALLLFYLNKLPHTPNPAILAASFRLKLLMHDGLIHFPLQERDQIEGSASRFLEPEELVFFNRIATSQSYRELCLSEMTPEIERKITLFFECYVNSDC